MFEFFAENNLIPHNQSDLNQMIHTLTNFYRLLMKYKNHLTAVLMVVVYFYTYLKRLITYDGISGNLLDTITDFSNSRTQEVALNGQIFLWTSIEAGLTQGSTLRPLLSLVYIKDLSDDLITDLKLFANDTSLFFCSPRYVIHTSANSLNNDLSKVSDWAMQ